MGATFVASPAFAQTSSGITRTPWQIHRGIPLDGKANDIVGIQLKDANDPAGFAKMNIPPANHPFWTTPPRDAKNNISLDEQSALTTCASQVDFTYFQTEVDVPKDAKITDFKVSFDQVDDLARIYIFNSKSKDAHSNDIVGRAVATSDLLQYVAFGEKNRIVIAQFDSCKVKNTIKNIQIEVKAGANAAEETIPVINRFYVDKDAKGNATGISWTDAYTNVQDALDVAVGGTEIWIADGVYYPDVGGGKADNDRSASFVIPSGVVIHGSFTGKEKTLAERKVEKVTILSGDIDQNDTNTTDKFSSGGFVNNPNDIKGANSYHVVYLDGTVNTVTNTTLLDGLMITAGQADGKEYPTNSGGGLFCHANGKGDCSPTLTHVEFRGNTASENGGGMYNDGRAGGNSDPTLTNVTFLGNAAQFGGGLYNFGDSKGDSSPMLTNVIFKDNVAKKWGGAMLNQGEKDGKSTPALVNVTFTGNTADDKGGAVYNYGDGGTSSPTLTNVILWKNMAKNGGPSIYNKNAKSSVAFSLVENGADSIAGEGTHSNDYKDTNKTGDPLFVTVANDIKNSPCLDVNLKTGSAAIGIGDPKAVPAGVTTDRNGNGRITNGKVSAGACEYTSK